MKNITRQIIFILAVLILVLPVIGACKAAPPPTLEQITFFNMGDFSGPYASSMFSCRPGHEDAVEYINTQMGGIGGVPVKYAIMDNSNKMDVGISQYEELRAMSPKPLIAFAWVSAQAEALKARYAEDKIPLICTGTPKGIYPGAYSFSYAASYSDEFGYFIDWVLENWKEKRPPKIAILTWDTAYGRGCISPEASAYAKAKNVDIVATELFPMTSLDVSTALATIRTKEPDWIYTNTLTTGPVTILKSGKDLGYRFKFAGGHGIGWDAIALGGSELMEGTIRIAYELSWDDTDSPAMKKLNQIFTSHNRTTKERDQMYLHSWCVDLVAAQAISKAVEKVGWQSLNGEAVYNQLIRTKDYAPLGGLAYYTYTQEIRSPRIIHIEEIRNGKLIPAKTRGESPDLRPGGPWTPK